LAYIQHVLEPTLQPGDIVIADNLSSHKVACVKEALTQWSASIIYLPPYSPDLNPIENFFSKLKALLRRAAERSFDGLVKAMRENGEPYPRRATISRVACSNPTKTARETIEWPMFNSTSFGMVRIGPTLV